MQKARLGAYKFLESLQYLPNYAKL